MTTNTSSPLVSSNQAPNITLLQFPAVSKKSQVSAQNAIVGIGPEDVLRRKLASIRTLGHFQRDRGAYQQPLLSFESLQITAKEKTYKMLVKESRVTKRRDSKGKKDPMELPTPAQVHVPEEGEHEDANLPLSSDDDSITNDINARDYDSLLRRLAHYSPVKRKTRVYAESLTTTSVLYGRKRSRQWTVSRRGDNHVHIHLPTSTTATPRAPSSASSRYSSVSRTSVTPRSALIPTTIPDKTRLIHDQTHYSMKDRGEEQHSPVQPIPPSSITPSPVSTQAPIGPLRRYSASSIPTPARASAHHQRILDVKAQDKLQEKPLRRSSSESPVPPMMLTRALSPTFASHERESHIESPVLKSPPSSRKQSAKSSTRERSKSIPESKKKVKMTKKMRMFQAQVMPKHGVVDLFPSTMERRMAKLQQRFHPAAKSLATPSKNNNLSVDLTALSHEDGEV